MDIEYEIITWLELQQCYLEEVNIGKDVKLNSFLAEHAQKEIDKLLHMVNDNKQHNNIKMDKDAANALALKVNTSETDSQYATIKKRIKELAQSGRYELIMYETLHPDVKNEIESEGYKVTFFDDQRENFYQTTISWA